MAVLNLHSLPSSRIPPGAVYIGRANARLGLPQSPFANPFVIRGVRDTAARAEVIEKYKKWLWDNIRSERFTLDDLAALDGKHLVCYCAPMACHGYVLEKAVKWAVERKAMLEASGQHGHAVEKPAPEARPQPTGVDVSAPKAGFSAPPLTPSLQPSMGVSSKLGRPPKLG